MEHVPGQLGHVSAGEWEAIHADWPAYPGDKSWEVALLRFGDFPTGTQFTCLDIIDQCALMVAEVGIRELDRFDERHIHVAVRLSELIDLDERGLITGVEFDSELTPEQMHLKRTLGPDAYDRVMSGREVIGTMIDGQFRPTPLPVGDPLDDEWEEDWNEDPRTPEHVAIFEGTTLQLTEAAQPEIEHVGKSMLNIPASVQNRIPVFLSAQLFDTAVRDLGATLETRMRQVTGTTAYGHSLIDQYIQLLLDDGSYLPARLRSLRQELRAIFKFVRNEFAHGLHDIAPSRGYALVSRMCWHVRDIELITESLRADGPS
jgi:hypothetical protein